MQRPRPVPLVLTATITGTAAQIANVSVMRDSVEETANVDVSYCMLWRVHMHACIYIYHSPIAIYSACA